jgi:3-phenylpropionate/cinnamic acid dioxygenase small subunit
MTSRVSVGEELLIRQTLARYCFLIDDGRFDDLVEWFTTDGTFVVRGVPLVGKDAIREWLRTNHVPHKRGKHLTTNVVIDVDGNRAHCEADFLFLNFVDGQITPAFTGRYTDDFVKADGRWLFERRDVVISVPANDQQ